MFETLDDRVTAEARRGRRRFGRVILSGEVSQRHHVRGELIDVCREAVADSTGRAGRWMRRRQRMKANRQTGPLFAPVARAGLERGPVIAETISERKPERRGIELNSRIHVRDVNSGVST